MCSSFANRPFIMPTKQSMTAAFSTHILEGRERERERKREESRDEQRIEEDREREKERRRASTPSLQPCSSR